MFSTLALVLSLPASAGIRLYNGTDQPLTVDVLHASHQDRDVVLPVGHELSKVLGAELASGETEMLVVRDAAGKELKRQAVQTDGIYALNTFSNSVVFTFVGRFRNKPSNGGSLQLVNTTGKPLAYTLELPDFSKRQSDGVAPRDEHAVNLVKIPNVGKLGDERKVTLSAPGVQPLQASVTVGWPVQVGLRGDSLVLEPLHD